MRRLRRCCTQRAEESEGPDASQGTTGASRREWTCIDHFKRLSDTLGHVIGDQVIRGPADGVRQQVGAMKIRDRRSQQALAQVTISAGVAALAPGVDTMNWIARADAALYRSHQAGRNRVMC